MLARLRGGTYVEAKGWNGKGGRLRAPPFVPISYRRQEDLLRWSVPAEGQ